MRYFSVIAALSCAVLFACGGPAPEAPAAETTPDYLIYFGTGGGDAKGIYVSEFDSATGEVSPAKLAATASGAGFLEIHPSGDFVFATARDNEGEEPWNGVAAYGIDHSTGTLTEINRASGVGRGPAHVNVSSSGKAVSVANYGSGSVASFQVDDDGRLSEAVSFFQHEGSSVNPERQKEPHAHSVNYSPDDRFLFVADLGTDEVVIYAHDDASGKLEKHGAAKVAPGGGPRHLAFDPQGRFVYVINEMGGSITVFEWDSDAGSLTEVQTISTLPEDFTDANKTSEVLVHPSGKFVYGANRGHDSIAVFSVDAESGELSFVERVAEGIAWPRNFRISPDGKLLLVGNRNSDEVAVFAVDPGTGKLSSTEQRVAVPQPICIRFVKRRN